MQYHFSSFSLPGATLPELLGAAETYGYEGVELRLDAGHRHGVETTAEPARRSAALAAVSTSGLAISCLCTPVRFADPAESVPQLADCFAAIDLASDVGVRYVRVFGGPIPDDVSRIEARTAMTAALSSAAEHAAQRDVVVLLESHDDWARPAELSGLMRTVDHPHAGILWDIWHTGRQGHSSIADAYEEIGPWIRHVEFHDGLLRTDRLTFRPIGEGEVDHLELLACLSRGRYPGVLVGEWINWEPAGLHLPRELATMRHYERLLGLATPS